MRGRGGLVFSGFVILLILSGCSALSSPPLMMNAVPTKQVSDSQLTSENLSTSGLVNATSTPINDPHIAGANCASCHSEEHKRWAVTMHAASAEVVLTNPEHNQKEPLSDDCLYCHAPFQAGEYNVESFVEPIDQTGPWKIVAENSPKWQAIQCESCHQPTSKSPFKLAFFDAAEGDYVPVKNSTELCEKCHKPGVDDHQNLQGSVHEGLQCAACHFVKGSEMSLDPKQSCAQCHPQVSPKHPDVTQLDTTMISLDSRHDIHQITCQTCHPSGTPGTQP